MSVVSESEHFDIAEVEPGPDHVDTLHSVKEGNMHRALPKRKPVMPGNHESGKRWAEFALHPAAHDKGVCPGFPGNDSADICLLHFRDEIVIPPPGDMDSDTTWSADMICQGTVMFMRKRYVKGGAATVSYGNWVASDTAPTRDNYTVLQGETGRSVCRALTLSMDAPSLSDQGIVYAAQQPAVFRPEVLARYPDITSKLEGTGPNFTGVESYNTSAITLGKLPKTAGGTAAGLNQIGPLWAYSPNQGTLVHRIAQQSSRSFMGKAKDGVYIPFKLATGENAYLPCCGITSIQYGNTAFADSGTTWGEGVKFLWGKDAEAATTLPAAFGAMFDNFNGAVICFENMSKASRIVGMFRMTLEVTPRPESPYLFFKEPPPPADFLAIQEYQNLSRILPDGYPASYNDLGFLGDLLGELAPVAGTVIGGLVGGPEGAAVGGQLGSVVGNLAKGSKKKKKKEATGAQTPSNAQAMTKAKTSNVGARLNKELAAAQRDALKLEGKPSK